MKSASRKIQENYLARPSPGMEWEIWTTNASDSQEPRLVRTAVSLEGPEVKTLRVIGLPTFYVLGFARWLQTADEALVSDMVQALLDRNGLLPRQSGGQLVSWTALVKEEARTLVVIRILTGNIPAEICLERVERYEAAIDLQPLPRQGLVLWLEGERLAAAFTREGRAIHLQSFSSKTVTPEIATELLCTRHALETEEILAPIDTIELRGDFPPENSEILKTFLGVPPVQEPLPPPIVPKQASGLLPALVADVRLKVLRRKRMERLLAGIAAVYVLLVFAYVVNVLWLAFQTSRLRSKIAANRSTVETIRSTAERWRALESAITPSIYPIEVLYQSAGLLPADGVRFTLFEQRANRVTIRGEANDAAAAFKLVDDIKGRPELNYFDWQMPRPNILPNDKAEFQIQGTPPDAPAN